MFKKTSVYDQPLEGLEFMGEEYGKLVEILTVATDDNFILNSDVLILIVQTITLKSIRNLLFKKEVFPKKIEGTLLEMGLLLSAQDVTSRHEDIPRQ